MADTWLFTWGNGQIVHASNSQDGIKISNDATYRTIVSVRRLV